MKKIKVISGAPGTGKSAAMKKIIIEAPGRYIFAAPRKDLLDDALADLRRDGYEGTIECIYQDNSKGVSVDQRITDFLKETACSTSAVALITHPALLGADMERFADWRLMLDEAPANAVMTGTLHARASRVAVEQIFSLQDDPQGREGIMLLKAKPGNVHDLLDDPQMEGLANLWRRARSCEVFIKCRSWDDIAAKRCPYVSVWSLDAFEPFSSVTIAAAGLEHSLVHLCNPKNYNAAIQPPHPSTGVIRVHCFDTVTRAGSGFFGSVQGQSNLAKVAEYLGGVRPQYWTCNSAVKDFLLPLMPGGYVSPLQEGSNRLRDCRSCAAIYSAKVTPSDQLILEIFGITAEQISRAREDEHLSQFVMRGAPRCPGFSGLFDIYVYDLWQALRLQDYLTGVGFPAEVKIIHLEGMLRKAPPKARGRKAVYTLEEAKERKKHHDQDAYDKKVGKPPRKRA